MKTQTEFKLIDLSYIKEISQGDLDYERKITKLFIEIIPENLVDLKIYFELKSYDNLRKILHHMQSSIGVMGLNKKLYKHMDLDFYEESNVKLIGKNLDFIIKTCNAAIEEAKDYFKYLAK